MTRVIRSKYRDPVDEIWLGVARRLGLTVKRSDEVYASYDAAGTLWLSESTHFDADDSLAQLIFHELCHAAVAGPEALSLPDWGLCNTDDSSFTEEHGCHRLQAALAARFGLRGFFAVTTDHRQYWDSLPEDPLAPGSDPAIAIAREALERLRSSDSGWLEALEVALEATARVASVVDEFATDDSLWKLCEARHATGAAPHRDPRLRCADCAWSFPAATPGRLQCRYRAGHEYAFSADLHACDRFQPPLDEAACADCGACCREGFHMVLVDEDDPFRRLHPELIEPDRDGFKVPRPDGNCVGLKRGPDGYRCQVYGTRPVNCREFEVAGDACLEARRRVQLSP